MIKADFSVKKPLVGFFPLFYNLAETGRAALVAQQYEKLGGEVVFFSHGGEYEYLVRELGYEIIRVNPIYSEGYIDLLWKFSRLEKWKNPFSQKILNEHMNEEIAAFKKTGIKLVVSTNNLPCYISARVAKIPLVFVTPKIILSFIQYPDDAEFLFTRLLPQWLKLKILNWYAPRAKSYARTFNKVAKKYNVPHLKIGSDINKGDYTFYTDSIEFLGLDKTTIPSNEYYIGPILLDGLISKNIAMKDSLKDQYNLEKHVGKNGKSILLALGSSGTKELFLRIIDALNKTNYNVIAVYTSILKEGEIPEVNDNILLKKFVPSLASLHKLVDLAIIHGGQGTVHTAAYAGKPVIGFPMQFEQHLNLELLVKHGMAILESRKYFKEQTFLKTIQDVFDNYDFYLKNAQCLAGQLSKPEGDKNAARILVKILKQDHLV